MGKQTSGKHWVCWPAAMARKCFICPSTGDFALSICGRCSAARLLARAHRAESAAPTFPASDTQAVLTATISFYTQWASGAGGNLDKALLYVTPSLGEQIRADPPSLLKMMGVPTRPKYVEVAIRRIDSASALVRATLQLDSGKSEVDTTLDKQNGAWLITKFQPAAP